MTSKDETIYIKEETFNLKMNSLEKRFDKLENLIETEIRLNNQAHEHLQTSIYWGFAIATLTIAVVIAIVGFVVTLAPSLRENSKRKESKYTTVEQVQSIVENAISKALLNIGK